MGEAMSIFNKAIMAFNNWALYSEDEQEQFERAEAQIQRAEKEFTELRAAIRDYKLGKAGFEVVAEEAADVCIFMQACIHSITPMPLDSMIEYKSAKVLEREGVMLGGSYVKEKDLVAAIGQNAHSFSVGDGLFRYRIGDSEYPYNMPLDVAANLVRRWMENREL